MKYIKNHSSELNLKEYNVGGARLVNVPPLSIVEVSDLACEVLLTNFMVSDDAIKEGTVKLQITEVSEKEFNEAMKSVKGFEDKKSDAIKKAKDVYRKIKKDFDKEKDAKAKEKIKKELSAAEIDVTNARVMRTKWIVLDKFESEVKSEKILKEIEQFEKDRKRLKKSTHN